MKETDLFHPVRKMLLEKMGCNEVYAEVLNNDVVALKGNVTVIIEMKMQLNFKVIEQAMRSTHRADYIFVAVPKPKTNHSKIAHDLLKSHKIGLIYIEDTSWSGFQADIYFWGGRNNKKNDVRKYIRDIHSRTVGGVKSGEGITEYQEMIEDIKRFMRRKEWVSIDELLTFAEGYYKNPKASLISTLKAHWNSNWCDIKKENRKTYYKIKES